jgi:oligopeptide transport system substrate-binding protein
MEVKMKNNSKLLFFFVTCLMIIMSACSQTMDEPSPTELVAAKIDPTEVPNDTVAPTQAPTATLIPTETPTATQAPTDTPAPTETPTAISIPESMMGTETIPLDQLSTGMPWLDLVFPTPRNKYLLFNFRTAVFDDPLVRQALSYAVDREAISVQYSQNFSAPNQPATVITPPEILGRDLYGSVGIHYDPQKAKDLFAEAGYQNPSDFPEFTFLVTPSGDGVSDANLEMANSIIEMWREHLGISARIDVNDNFQGFLSQLYDDSYDIALLSWLADYNDPNNFLREPFSTNGLSNVNQYSNSEFDRLVKEAVSIHEPADRQLLYILAEDILCQQDPAVIPLFFYGDPNND